MKKLILIIITILSNSFLLIGCGDSDDDISNNLMDTYTLEFNDCSTGTHTFRANSRTELNKKVCRALLDDELNNYCAFELRMIKADNYCD